MPAFRPACAGTLVAACVVAAQLATDDQTLIAYRLTTAQETSILQSDGTAPSAMWEQWDVQNAQTLQRDYAVLSTTAHAWNRAGEALTDDSDASMTIQAAYGEQGLYLLSSVTDDDIVAGGGQVCIDETCESDVRAADAVNLFLEQNSWASLEGGDIYGTFPMRDSNSFAYGTVQIQMRFGTGVPSERCHVAMYSYTEMGLAITSGTAEDAATNHDGMLLRVFEPVGGVAVQEWFVPWSQFGPMGFFTTPEEGRELSFSGGYDDMDAADGTGLNSLRFVPGTDPASCPQTSAVDRCVPWGALLLGPALVDDNAVAPERAGSQIAASGMASAVYDLLGRLVEGNAHRGSARTPWCVRSAYIVGDGITVVVDADASSTKQQP